MLYVEPQIMSPDAADGHFSAKSARVAELADALDLGSSGQPWGFNSPLSHHTVRSGVISSKGLIGIKH